MRLLVISNMPHYVRSDATIVGWPATVEELDHLATRFSSVRHIACLHDGTPPSNFAPYRSESIELVPMRPTGGDQLRDKIGVMLAMPEYVRVMLRELSRADVVHLRCPANLPMVGAALLPFLRRPALRWIKYGGNWRPETRGSLAFAWQRWLLAKPWHRAVVTVNGHWTNQPGHVQSFYNPSLEDDELAAARALAESKRLELPSRLIFVGNLSPAKGCDIAIDAVAALAALGVDVSLDMVGDGPHRQAYEQQAKLKGVDSRVHFHGWVARNELPRLYARAHFNLFPSRSEGWPKVLSEGMAYGVVPIASAVGAIPEYLSEFRVGRSICNFDPLAFARAIASYGDEVWKTESMRAVEFARLFSYGHYLRAVDDLLRLKGST